MIAGLAGRSVLVVGASAGIGRSFALGAVRSGAEVCLAARRAELLDEAVEEAGGGITAVADVCSEEGCRQIVDRATGSGGQLDLVLYTVGTARLRWLSECTSADWRAVLDTNLVGFNQIARFAVGAMAPGGIVAALSSEAVGQARVGMAAYGASKAALEESLVCWRAEHPEVRFSCVAVGATVPTGFGDSLDLERLGSAFEDWGRLGLIQERFMTTDSVADVLVATLGTALEHPDVNVEHVRLRSPSRVVGTYDSAIGDASRPTAD